jgi:hypothetical protein
MRHKYRFLAGLLGFSAILAIAVATRVPFSEPNHDAIRQAQEWVSSRRIAGTFAPIAYPLLIAPAYCAGGIHGVIALQVALQVALVATCFFFLLQLGISARAAAFGALPVALHPDLLLSITRSWDVALSTFLLVLFVLLFLRVQAEKSKLNVSLIGGVVFATAVFARPNYLLAALTLLYALSSGEKTPKEKVTRDGILALIVFAISGFLTYSFLGIVGHDAIFFPQNGPYNLFAGNNPYSAHTFFTDFNGEPSINPAYRAGHPELSPSAPSPNYHDHTLNNYYLSSSIQFALRHPTAEVKLFGIKLFTFFRPDIRSHSLSFTVSVVKCFLALPVVFFLILLALAGRVPLDRVDRLLLLIYAAYILPFLLTNSDPRFRIPFDVLLLLHSVRLLVFRWKATDRAHQSGGSSIRDESVLATFSSGMLL